MELTEKNNSNVIVSVYRYGIMSQMSYAMQNDTLKKNG